MTDKISIEMMMLIASFVILASVGTVFFNRWQIRADSLRREENMLARQQLELQQAREAASQKNMMELLERVVSQKDSTDGGSSEKVGPSSDGYIIVNLPESKKGLFQDLLRGFEDYARILGYVVRFSVDSSITDKMAFKFTLESGGIAVSTAQVKSDLREYIRKVERNEPLDDLPVILPEHEHNLLLTALKNRIAYLQNTATMQKNTIDYYNTLFRQLPNQSLGILPAQNIILQSGQGNQAPSYHALNSPQAVQGMENRLIGNRIDESIRIASSFNEREEQVQALGHLWLQLYERQKQSDGKDKEVLANAADLIHKAEAEMKEEEPPEPVRIKRWLETAKNSLATFALTAEVTEAARKVWELFKIGS